MTHENLYDVFTINNAEELTEFLDDCEDLVVVTTTSGIKIAFDEVVKAAKKADYRVERTRHHKLNGICYRFTYEGNE